MTDYYVGLDLGQANDFSAIAVAEEPVWVGEPSGFDGTAMWPPDRRGWVSGGDLVPAQRRYFRSLTYAGYRPDRPPLYLRHLERMRHLSYSTVVARVAELLRSAPLAEAETVLLVDYGGVGRGIFDMLEAAALEPIGITITGGNEPHAAADGGWNVPKRDLVVATQAMLQDGRLRIASGLEHAPTLTKELQDYRVKLSPAGHDSYDARSGQHDDLVLAVSLVCWFRDYYFKHYDAEAERAKRTQPQGAYR